MSAMLKPKDLNLLKRFIPLNTLSDEQFAQLISELDIEEVEKGGLVFDQGDFTKEFIYLISGSIALYAGEMEMEVITTGSEAARFAIAHQLPRKVKGAAKTKSRIVRVPTNKLDKEKKPKPAETYMVDEQASQGGDWMATMLQSPVFQKLPAANLQKVMMKMEEVAFEPGQMVVKQGDPADYYYIIKQGTCELTRQSGKDSKPIKLAELHDCASFGEDALLSDAPRNVTVTMKGNGQLLRLTKEDFITLVKEPVLQYVDFDEASGKVQEGAAWLDVRDADIYKDGHIEESNNIPFFSLRMKISALKHDQLQLLVCENGRTSEAAAFLLLKFGFNALILKGGMDAIKTIKKKTEKTSNVNVTPSEKEPVIQAEVTELPSKDDLLGEAQHKISELEALCATLNEEQNQISLERDALQKDKNSHNELLATSQSTLTLYKEQIEALEKAQLNLGNEYQEVLKKTAQEKNNLEDQLKGAQEKLVALERNVLEENNSSELLQQQLKDLNNELQTKDQELEKQCKALNIAQSKLTDSEQEVSKRLALLEKENQQLNLDKEKLGKERELANTNLKALEEEKVEFQKTIELHAETSGTENAELVEKAQTLESEKAALEREVVEARSCQASLKEQVDSLSNDLKSKDDEIQKQFNNLDKVQVELAEEKQKTGDRLESLEKENRQLINDKTWLGDECEAVNKTMSALKRENADLQKKVESHNESKDVESTNSAKRIVELQSEKMALEERLLVLEEQLSSVNSETSNLNDKLSDAHSLLDEQSNKNKTLLVTLAEYEKKTEKNNVLHEKLDKLEESQRLDNTKLYELSGKNESLQDKLERERQQLTEVQAKLDESINEVGRLKSQKSSQSDESEDYANQVAEVEKLSKELANAKENEEAVRGSFDELGERVVTLEKQLDKAYSVIETVQADLDKERGVISELNVQLKSAEQLAQDSKGTMDMLTTEKQSMEDALKQQLNDLKNELITEQEVRKVAAKGLSDVELSSEALSSTVDRLTEELQQVKVSKQADVERIRQLEKSLLENDQKSSDGIGKVEALESELADEKLANEEKVQQLTLSLQSSQKEMGALSLKLDELLDAKTRLENEKISMDQKVALYEQNKQALTDNIKSLEEKLSKPEESQETSEKIKLLEEQLDEAKTALVDMEIKFDNIDEETKSEGAEDSELLAVKSELLLVREQTEGDIAAMKEMLDNSNKMNLALKKELLSLQAASNEANLQEPQKKKKGLWR